MKARISLILKTGSAEESQKVLGDLLDRLVADGVAESYSFEIESENGPVTERCVISEGRVIA